MGAYYDEIEIEDMAWDDVKRVYHYPCPCGDRFEISRAQLRDCEDIATCPSCSLIIRVVYDPLDYEDEPDEDDDEEGESAGSDEEDEEDGSSGDGEFVDALEKLHVDDDKSSTADAKEASDPVTTVPVAVAVTASA